MTDEQDRQRLPEEVTRMSPQIGGRQERELSGQEVELGGRARVEFLLKAFEVEFAKPGVTSFGPIAEEIGRTNLEYMTGVLDRMGEAVEATRQIDSGNVINQAMSRVGSTSINPEVRLAVLERMRAPNLLFQSVHFLPARDMLVENFVSSVGRAVNYGRDGNISAQVVIEVLQHTRPWVFMNFWSEQLSDGPLLSFTNFGMFEWLQRVISWQHKDPAVQLQARGFFAEMTVFYERRMRPLPLVSRLLHMVAVPDLVGFADEQVLVAVVDKLGGQMQLTRKLLGSPFPEAEKAIGQILAVHGDKPEVVKAAGRYIDSD